jgi:hypothetical protein
LFLLIYSRIDLNSDWFKILDIKVLNESNEIRYSVNSIPVKTQGFLKELVQMDSIDHSSIRSNELYTARSQFNDSSCPVHNNYNQHDQVAEKNNKTKSWTSTARGNSYWFGKKSTIKKFKIWNCATDGKFSHYQIQRLNNNHLNLFEMF